jgi:hypothetical protein
MYFASIYENRRIKPVEIVLRREEQKEGKIYCKHICIFQDGGMVD